MSRTRTHPSNQATGTPRIERPFAGLRKALGMSLEYAAAQLRMHPHTLRGLELARGPLTQPVAARMCRLYGCDLNQLTQLAHPHGAGEVRTNSAGPGASGNAPGPLGSAAQLAPNTQTHTPQSAGAPTSARRKAAA